MRKSNVVGGVLLIFFGLVFLAGNMGYIDAGYFYRLGQLWPLWLVVGGCLMLARTYPGARYVAGGVVGLMLLMAVTAPRFMDSFRGYRYWHHWEPSTMWGLLFLAGSVWVLYSLFGKDRKRAAE